MDIVVKGRNVEVPDHYRALVSEKLARLERYDRKVIRYDVELFHEPNRRQAKSCQRVEITGLVRAAYFAPTRKLLVEVSLGAYRIRVFPKLPPHVNPESLRRCPRDVRGTRPRTEFRAARRQTPACIP